MFLAHVVRVNAGVDVVGPGSAHRATPSFVLGMLAALGPLTVDSYLPALPFLGPELHASQAQVEATLAATMLGFALGQLLIGPWSDAVGRRLPLTIGVLTVAAASVGAALATDVAVLMAMRFAQGLGAAAAIVTALATARDQHSGADLARVLGSVALVSSLAPLVAPIAGSVILTFSSWRGIFVFLGAYGALALLLGSLTRLPRRDTLQQPSTMIARYRRLIGDRTFVGLLALAGLRFIALFAFLQWAPFIFQSGYGISATAFGVLFAVMTLGMMVGLQLSPRMLRRGVSPVRVLWLSLAVMSMSGLALLVCRLLPGPAVWTTIVCVVFLLGCGLGLPTIQTLALNRHPRDAGTAAGLIGAVGFGAAALASPLLSLLPAAGVHEDVALGAVVTTAAAAGAVVLACGSRAMRERIVRVRDVIATWLMRHRRGMET
jgi:MFS transporter, DHA1 family, multidrug resistance protein